MSDFEDILNEADDTEETVTETSTETTESAEAEASTKAVETPATETAATEEVEATTERTDEGYTKDARGVWHRPDGTIASKDEVERLGAAAPTTESAPVVQPVPFQYRAAGATHALEGATLNEAGDLVVPATQVSAIREALNARHLVQGEYGPTLERYKSEVAELRQRVTQGTAGEARATALVDALSNIINTPDDTEAVEAFFALRANFPSLVAKAEADYWKTRATSGQQPRGQQPETARTEASPALPDANKALDHTLDVLESVKLEHTYRDVSADDWKQIEAQVRRTPFLFFRPATAEEAQQYEGVAPGEIVFDADAVKEHIEQRAAQRRKARETATAARFNANQAPKVPTLRPRTTATVAASAGKNGQQPKGWEDRFKEAWSDDDDE